MFWYIAGYLAIGFILFGMYTQAQEHFNEPMNHKISWVLILLWPVVILVWIGAEIAKRLSHDS